MVELVVEPTHLVTVARDEISWSEKMAQYQNLFTTVQATGPIHDGVPLGKGNSPRVGEPVLNYWIGKIGNAQLGPIYLGGLGIASLL